MAAASLAIYATHVWTFDTTILDSVNVVAGDLCFVSALGDNFPNLPYTVSQASGTATISTVTTTQTVGSAGHDGDGLYTFSVTGSGTLVVAVTPTGMSSFMASLVVATGSTGFTSTTHVASSTLVQSFTASAGSHVFAALSDYNAVATNTTAWTPAGAVEDYAMTDGVSHKTTAGGGGSCFQAHWLNVAGGAVDYGLTAPSSSNIQIMVWEVLAGTATTVLPKPLIKQQAVNRSYTY